MSAVDLAVDSHIAVLTLDRPPANAFNRAMYRDLLAAVQRADADSEVRVIVIRAEGRFFSAGNDVHAFAEAAAEPDGEPFEGDVVETALQAVLRATKPVISLVQGVACGSGFCIAAYSDIVIATEHARFGIPEVRVGVVGGAPEAAYALPQKITRYLALTGELITAADAYRVGFVSKLVADDALEREGRRTAELILRNPPLTVRYAKESLANIYPPERVAALIDDDGPRFLASLRSVDHGEAVAAFLERRPPQFTGR